MTELDPALRRIISLPTEDFRPYDRFGTVRPGLTWLPLSKESADGGPGCFAIRFAPGATSQLHVHSDVEEFYVLEGELIDSDGGRLKAGDFVSYEAGSQHSSHAPEGAVILVFLRVPNQRIDED
ncbi:MAG: cupin domain-containing protein [Pseudomonadota bacterium]